MIYLGEQARVLQKGKITIPAGIRQKLDIKEGDKIEFQIINNKLVLFPPNTIANPTEALIGLASEVQAVEPIKDELKKSCCIQSEKENSKGEAIDAVCRCERFHLYPNQIS